MRNYIALIFLAISTLSCVEESEIPSMVTEPNKMYLIKSDTIQEGKVYNAVIGMDANEVYNNLIPITKAMEIDQLHIVANSFETIEAIENRLPLYSYAVFNQKHPTTQGLQLTLENGNLQALWYNSKSYASWPISHPNALQLGDNSSQIIMKLSKLAVQNSYRTIFEKIQLHTKSMKTEYDPIMHRSPMWYFAFVNADGIHEEVQLYFKEGILYQIVYNQRI